jgi:DNA-binding NarL/FixJ family response regulator
MITLLLVDDDPLLRQGLRSWLERAADITVVGEASSGAEAMVLAHTLHPDVLLMDISLPISDRMAATAAFRTLTPHSALVLLSLYDDATTRARAHAAGVRTVVGKQEGIKALLAAIREAGTQGRWSPGGG